MRSNYLKKISAILIVLLLTVMLVPVTTNATTEEKLEDYVELDGLKAYVQQELLKGIKINLSYFNIPESMAEETEDFIKNAVPEIALGGTCIVETSNGKVSTLHANFRGRNYEETKAAADVILQGIEGNDNLSDIEKALLIHDRLVLWTTYDYENYQADTIPSESYSGYGALVKQISVCSGYAEAYDYLVSRVGLKCRVHTSGLLDHAWNVIYIDGKAYQVDTTWDDPVNTTNQDVEHKVSHANFLNSGKSGFADEIDADKYDTTYDNVNWGDRYFVINHKIYSIQNSRLYRVENTKMEQVTVAGKEYISVNTPCIDVGDKLLCSRYHKLYLLDVETGEEKVVYEAKDSSGNSCYIDNLKYKNDNIVCEFDGKEVYPFENTQYTVTFKNWDGSVIQSDTYHYGQVVRAPQDPTRSRDENYSYRFSGWDQPVNVCTGDMVYTAQYQTKAKTYVVTFKDWDGSTILSWYCHYGDTIVVPTYLERPSGEGYSYKFVGWDKTLMSTCTDDATYTAVYEKKYVNYRVEFRDWDGSLISYAYYHYGDTIVPPKNPVRPSEGASAYTFAGWNKPIVPCKGSATYTATYQESIAEYTIVFKNWDGTILHTQVYKYGDWPVCPVKPTRPSTEMYNYIFNGWEGIGSVVGDATYTALYREEYRVYYVVFENWNGMILGSNGYHYGDALNPPENPVRPSDSMYNYVFIGWDKPATNCTGDAIYRAQYDAIPKYQQSGWMQVGQTWYYFKQGVAQIGWQSIGGTWYYFAGSGAMVTGWQFIGGTWYYFAGSGAMVTGWQSIGGTWYYFAGSGAMVTGWQSIGGTWYYFAGSGAMVTGWQSIGGTWYYFAGSGAMVTGWQSIGGTWYYFAGSGAMVTGWQTIGGTWYYFYGSGAMAANCWVGNYYLQADGSMATNKWIGSYYVGADGTWIP